MIRHADDARVEVRLLVNDVLAAATSTNNDVATRLEIARGTLTRVR